MKIYTEIIMKWDDKEGRLVESSSKSYNHKGEIDLCKKSRWIRGGRSDTWVAREAGKGNPGLQALRFKHGIFGGKGGQHSEKGPSLFDEVVGKPSGVQTIGDRVIPGVDIQPTSYSRIMGRKSGGGGKKKPRVHQIRKEFQAYAPQFKGSFYDPMVEATVRQPLAQAMEQQFQSASGIPQSVLSGYRACGGLTSRGGEGKYATPWGSGAIIEPALSGGAKGDLMGGLESAATSYQGALDEFARQEALQEDKRQQLFDTEARDKAKAEVAWQRGTQEAARKTADLLQGQVDRGDVAGAPYAKGGFAYSGPGERRMAGEEAKTRAQLRDIGVAKRTGRRALEGKVDEAIRAREEGIEGEGGVEDKLSDILAQRDVAAGDWTSAQRAYGEGLRGLMEAAAGEIKGMQDWTGALTGAHRQYGKEIDAAGDMPTFGYNLRAVPSTKLTGTTRFGAPTGGWWSETPEQLGPGLAQHDVDAAEQFRQYMLSQPGYVEGGGGLGQAAAEEMGLTDFQNIDPIDYGDEGELVEGV